LETHVTKGVKCVIYAEIFVGETGIWSVSQSAEGFDEFSAVGVDADAAVSGGIEETHVDGVDFVTNFPRCAGAGDGEAGFSED